MYRMKVTAIIDDALIQEVKACSQSPTITEAITVALEDWLALQHIKRLNAKVARRSLLLGEAKPIRDLNRRF
ncbi:hypothetical protein NO2_0671 [Candidatus Termititenax persephonae]|uniref:Antitoxin VapB n=1 Tax=Candidatus Termititenax persephonae TaxID=2218525 RepID=A0A388THA0_9BACT|nr:hypothetical protein NO2_0671 [Candidatus Termititenax persephonae]